MRKKIAKMPSGYYFKFIQILNQLKIDKTQCECIFPENLSEIPVPLVTSYYLSIFDENKISAKAI